MNKNIQKLIKIYQEYATDWIQGNNTEWKEIINGKEVVVKFSDVVKYLDTNNVLTEEIDPKDLESILIQTKREPKRIQASDLKYPIIVTRTQGRYKKVLDGQHRIVKALTNDIPTIKTRILDLDNAPEKFKVMFIEE